jgi:hypothetical protein
MSTNYSQYYCECPHCKNKLKLDKAIVEFIVLMELIHVHRNRFKNK